MADRVLFIGWGTPVRGREQLAAVREDEEFRRNTIDASLIGH